MSIILDGTNGITSVTGSASLTAAGPAFSAYGSAQQSVATGTWTKVAFNNKTFDTNNNFDATTNYRFTPTVAGYYQINSSILFNAGASTAVSYIQLYKNGSAYQYGSGMPLNLSNLIINQLSSLVYMNGSTDYLEMYMYQSSGANLNCGSSATIFPFSGVLVRSA